jgi:hypothetical protein
MSKTNKTMALPGGRQLTWVEQDMGKLHAVMDGRIDGELIPDAELQRLIEPAKP